MGRMDKNVAIGKNFRKWFPVGDKKIISSLRRAWKNGITDSQTIFYEDEFRRGCMNTTL
jgi:hypothetical protein